LKSSEKAFEQVGWVKRLFVLPTVSNDTAVFNPVQKLLAKVLFLNQQLIKNLFFG